MINQIFFNPTSNYYDWEWLTPTPNCNHWEWLIPASFSLIFLLGSLIELRRGHRAPPVAVRGKVVARREMPDSEGESKYALLIRAENPDNPAHIIEAEAVEQIGAAKLAKYPINQVVNVTWVPGKGQLIYLQHHTTMQNMKAYAIVSALALGICLYWGLF